MEKFAGAIPVSQLSILIWMEEKLWQAEPRAPGDLLAFKDPLTPRQRAQESQGAEKHELLCSDRSFQSELEERKRRAMFFCFPILPKLFIKLRRPLNAGENKL